MLKIEQKHPPRLQAPFLDYAFLRNRQHADFRRHDDQIIVGDDIACRAQAIAIQRGTDLTTVGEGNRGRAIPRLHDGCVKFVKRPAISVHCGVVGPGFRNHHHHRVGQREAAHHQQLQRVVERCSVRLAVINQRPDFPDVLTQFDRRNIVLARAYPIDIAAYRIDFAVVRNHTKRVG